MKSLLEFSKEINVSKQKIYRYYKKYLLLQFENMYTKVGDTIYLNEKGEAKIKQHFTIKNDAHHETHQIISNHINIKSPPTSNSPQETSNSKNNVHHKNQNDMHQSASLHIKNDACTSLLKNKPYHINNKKSHQTASLNIINKPSSVKEFNIKNSDDVHHITKNETHRTKSYRIKLKTPKSETKNLIKLMQTTINELSIQLQKKDKQIDDLSRLLENTQKLQLQLQMSTLETKSQSQTNFDNESENKTDEKKSFFNKLFFHKK